jgi:hypothetical protein
MHMHMHMHIYIYIYIYIYIAHESVYFNIHVYVHMCHTWFLKILACVTVVRDQKCCQKCRNSCKTVTQKEELTEESPAIGKVW